MILVCNTWEAGLEQVQGCSLNCLLWDGIFANFKLDYILANKVSPRKMISSSLFDAPRKIVIKLGKKFDLLDLYMFEFLCERMT